ncbi:ASCH domain-containing protein [Alkaliphilus hydrothermalis]|uniref:ASC-1-like (ASCH) protein n=1 Tax=Alkaliphilus hydrothermalis TaxID=1482730 RepID=A0ABS2NN16_9FIRM|nr:ASCH domain-containing protein [Alkaliphilus hydrothermalis]MBM7614341.1 ASC-1-like (ASCH) protein [Alkaliphilus hydrothermalis]
MIHSMTLNSNEFESIKNGIKTREYRLYDEKRQQLKIGDRIEFFRLPNMDESILTKIEGLLLYKNWYSCYEDFFEQDLIDHYESIKMAVQDTYDNWWSKEKEEKYGCLIIKIKKID